MDKFIIQLIATSRILIAGFFLSTVGFFVAMSLTSMRVSEGAKMLGILGIAYLAAYILNGIALMRLKEHARKDALYMDWGIILFDGIFFVGMSLVSDIKYGGFSSLFYRTHGSLILVLLIFVWVFGRPSIRRQFK
ncbi:MAG: hypothetical protein P9L90_02740 [Candidatus Aadella gelida]|nr:hypothetical protein [Candidatus Aadella gelida]